MHTRCFKSLINYVMIVGMIAALTQIGGCGGGGEGGGSGVNGPIGSPIGSPQGSPQYNLSGAWSGVTDQGESLAFIVEEIASYDITSLAYTLKVDGTFCSNWILDGNVRMLEPISDNEVRVVITEPGMLDLEFIFSFYFDNADKILKVDGTWYAEYAPCDAIGSGIFTARKGQRSCSDGDGDGYYNNCGQLDCIPDNADIYPGALEICNDAIDNNCDGLLDCDDPGCSSDPNCSKCTDADSDNYVVGAECQQASDCDDNARSVNPGAVEICHNLVDDDCDDPPDIDEGCSNNILNVTADYGTIQTAINAALHGDTVLVENGFYTENILFSGIGKAITVRSKNGPGATTISGDGSNSVVTFASGNGSTLSGFAVTNGSSSTNGGGIICGGFSSPTIDNCVITGNTASIGGGGIHCAPSSSPTVTNSTIQNNTVTAGTQDSNGGGIHAAMNSLPTITNCIISSNSSEYNGGGMAINTANAPRITNCVFSNNSAANNGGAISFTDSAPMITNCTLSNNTASGNGDAIAASSPRAGTAVVNSILWGNSPAGVFNEIAVQGGGILNGVTYSDVAGGYSGIGNINANPLFVGVGDYHLQAGSPCVDAGTSTGAPSKDIEGVDRAQGLGFDMGPYEQ